MTREEKRKLLVELIINAKKTDPETGSFTEYLADFLLGYGISIRPTREHTREQVEKARGEWRSVHGLSEYYCSRCGEEFEIHSYDKDKYRFCPYCMTPMTDKAVEMVTQRLEALYGQENT